VLRPLTADERAEHRAQGVPPFEIQEIRVWGDHQPVPVTEVFGLPDLSAHLRDAAQYLLDNRLLLSMVSIVDQPSAYEVEPDDATLTADRLELFLEFNHSLGAVDLEDVAFGPDRIATRFAELEVGDTRLKVTDDVPTSWATRPASRSGAGRRRAW
jgi:hypothetical protein